jgi:hypothetical protein
VRRHLPNPKSEYNLAWNSFNVHELKRLVVEKWNGWLDDNASYHRSLPLLDGDPGQVTPVSSGSRPSLSARAQMRTELVPRARGPWPFEPFLDTKKAGFNDARWMVSKKRTANLFDFAASIRKLVVQSQADAMEIDSANMDDW